MIGAGFCRSLFTHNCTVLPVPLTQRIKEEVVLMLRKGQWREEHNPHSDYHDASRWNPLWVPGSNQSSVSLSSVKEVGAKLSWGSEISCHCSSSLCKLLAWWSHPALLALNTIYVLVILKASVQLQPLPHLPSIYARTSKRHHQLLNLHHIPPLIFPISVNYIVHPHTNWNTMWPHPWCLANMDLKSDYFM